MSLANTRALAELLGLVPANQPTAEPEPEQEGPPDFDGGARETAPGPSDPEAEHNDFLIEALKNMPSGGGGQW